MQKLRDFNANKVSASFFMPDIYESVAFSLVSLIQLECMSVFLNLPLCGRTLLYSLFTCVEWVISAYAKHMVSGVLERCCTEQMAYHLRKRHTPKRIVQTKVYYPKTVASKDSRRRFESGAIHNNWNNLFKDIVSTPTLTTPILITYWRLNYR